MAAYAKTFGRMSDEHVFHSPDNRIPHVDIYVYPPTPECPFWIYVTDGVSDRRMAVPPEVSMGGVPSRIELMAYSESLRPSVPGLLKSMVDFAFSKRTFFGIHHTYAFGRAKGLNFREAVVAPLLYPGRRVFEPFAIEGDPVLLATVFPVTHREYERAVKHGADKVLAALAAAGASPAFDSDRKSAL